MKMLIPRTQDFDHVSGFYILHPSILYSPSRQRRRARRAAERKDKAEEASKVVTEKVQPTSEIDSEAENAHENVEDPSSSDIVIDAVEAVIGRREVTDEVCSDDIYEGLEPVEKPVGETSFRSVHLSWLASPRSDAIEGCAMVLPDTGEVSPHTMTPVLIVSEQLLYFYFLLLAIIELEK